MTFWKKVLEFSILDLIYGRKHVFRGHCYFAFGPPNSNQFILETKWTFVPDVIKFLINLSHERGAYVRSFVKVKNQQYK